MGSLLCCAACELASCTVGNVCKCLCPNQSLGMFTANIIYLLVLIVMTCVAFALQQWGAPHFELYSFTVGCTDIPGIDVAACKGEHAVYRISLGTAIWFACLALGNICSRRVHTRYWLAKLCALLCMVTGLFFVPMVGQHGYVGFARVVSGIFLVTQIVTFVDAAYHWNGRIVERGDEDERWFGVGFAICLFLLAAMAVSIVLMYIHYNKCARQSLFISLVVVAGLLCTVLQLHTYDSGSSLLTSCVVWIYAVYLCWVAVSSDECNHVDPAEEQLFIGCLVTACSLAWTCYSFGTKTLEYTNDSDSDSDIEEEEDAPSASLFHFIMASGAVYMSMLLTNWGTVAGRTSAAKMWVAAISQWISLALYAWTIVAPQCCPDRDFDPLT